MRRALLLGPLGLATWLCVACSNAGNLAVSSTTEPSPATACSPAPQGGPAPDGAADLVFAIRTIDFGAANVNTWRTLGCNIDGLVSDASSKNVCKPVEGAPPQHSQVDGQGGIDNSFGENILPIFLALASDFSTRMNDAMEHGSVTTILALHRVGGGASYMPVEASAYGGAPLGQAPKWDGSDVWPVTSESVAAGRVDAPLLAWDDGYMVERMWVSGTPTTPSLLVGLAFEEAQWLAPHSSRKSWTIWLAIHSAIVTFRTAPDGSRATEGTIAGVLDTEEWVRSFHADDGSQDCTLGTDAAILQQIRQASDVLSDGTQDPSKRCDGISIGLAFTAAPVRLGGVAAPVGPPPNPCVEALDASAEASSDGPANP